MTDGSGAWLDLSHLPTLPLQSDASLHPVASAFDDGGLLRFGRLVLERKALRVVDLFVMLRQRRLAAVSFVAVLAAVRTDAGAA